VPADLCDESAHPRLQVVAAEVDQAFGLRAVLLGVTLTVSMSRPLSRDENDVIFGIPALFFGKKTG
jgi:hypothetical protein